MAPLTQTLALLVLTVATAADEVKPLDTAQDSFDDQYRGCSCAMTRELPALNLAEFKQNKKFAEVWGNATAEWQWRRHPDTPLSPDHVIAIIALTMDGLSDMFNDAVHVAGRSRQEYRDNFHFKTLHFLLTDALAKMRRSLKGQCFNASKTVCGVWFEAQRGDTIRFGQFMSIWGGKQFANCCRKETVFQVNTCHGVNINFYSGTSQIEGVLIPPFESFEVTQVTQEGDKTQIQLRSTGTFSKYNCEWLRGVATGGNVPRATIHIGGLLLAPTALAVATGIL